MEGVALIAVIGAALLHATWNSIIKLAVDRFTAIIIINVIAGLASIPLLLFVEGLGEGGLSLLILSCFLHATYNIYLIKALSQGDFSTVYPLARGTAPIFVAIGMALFFSEILSFSNMLSMAGIIIGVMLIARIHRGMSLDLLRDSTITAFFIASYTIVDAIGARSSGTPNAYALWLNVGTGVLMMLLMIAKRKTSSIIELSARNWLAAVGGGLMSLAGYWIAIWAMTILPVATVSVVRETSIAFAVIIGAFFLKETITWVKAAGVVVIMVALMSYRAYV